MSNKILIVKSKSLKITCRVVFVINLKKNGKISNIFLGKHIPKKITKNNVLINTKFKMVDTGVWKRKGQTKEGYVGRC